MTQASRAEAIRLKIASLEEAIREKQFELRDLEWQKKELEEQL